MGFMLEPNRSVVTLVRLSLQEIAAKMSRRDDRLESMTSARHNGAVHAHLVTFFNYWLLILKE